MSAWSSVPDPETRTTTAPAGGSGGAAVTGPTYRRPPRRPPSGPRPPSLGETRRAGPSLSSGRMGAATVAEPEPGDERRPDGGAGRRTAGQPRGAARPRPLLADHRVAV